MRNYELFFYCLFSIERKDRKKKVIEWGFYFIVESEISDGAMVVKGFLDGWVMGWVFMRIGIISKCF